MNLTLSQLAAIIPPLLLIEAAFSGSEIAILSADRLRLQALAKKGNTGAALCLKLLQTPEKVLSSTLLMTSLCMIGITGLITLFFIQSHPDHSEMMAILITSPIIVLLGEFIPKSIFQRYADQIAPISSWLIRAVFYIFYPITRLLSLYTQRIAKIIGPIEEVLVGRKRSTRDEIQLMLSDGKNQSELKNLQKRMLKRIFEFKDSEAKHALIPLVRVEALEDTCTVREGIEKFHKNRHSRMPVYQDRIDNIVAVLELSDLYGVQDIETPVKLHSTPAHYVAETQSLDDLLLTMHREELEMAVVVDEYGGAIGIVTFEDIVEEIVGEINDEYDSENVPFKQLDQTRWIVQGRMELQAFHEQIGIKLPEGDYETLAGFLLQQFGRIPEGRDELFFNTEGKVTKFTVRQASERRIESVLVEVVEDSTVKS